MQMHLSVNVRAMSWCSDLFETTVALYLGTMARDTKQAGATNQPAESDTGGRAPLLSCGPAASGCAGCADIDIAAGMAAVRLCWRASGTAARVSGVLPPCIMAGGGMKRARRCPDCASCCCCRAAPELWLWSPPWSGGSSRRGSASCWLCCTTVLFGRPVLAWPPSACSTLFSIVNCLVCEATPSLRGLGSGHCLTRDDSLPHSSSTSLTIILQPSRLPLMSVRCQRHYVL